ncbi:MAG: TonB-dependent receptor [Acetobacterales bacterium]
MKQRSLTFASIFVTAFAATAEAETFNLEPIEVNAPPTHPSQQIRRQVERAFDQSRSTSSVDGSLIQNLNPVNNLDSVRYNATGIINTPFGGDRFGGGTKIRTFGDFGSARSIDGLPAFRLQGEEGGGYSNALVPAIAIDRVDVVKGSRGVQYGDGTDGGVVDTVIKSGRGYDDHMAGSFDASTANEGIVQAEAADDRKTWDYYAAGSWLEGRYDRNPPNLEEQSIQNGVGKVGFNISPNTRAEFMALGERNRPDIVRNDVVEPISSDVFIGSATVDTKLNDRTGLRFGQMYTDSHSIWDARSRDRSLDNYVTFADGYYSAPVSETVVYDGSAGLQYMHTNLLRDNLWDNTFDDYSARMTNAFTFDGNLVLSGGLRLTWFNNDIVYDGETQPDNLDRDKVWSYEFGASYNVLENTRLRGSVASGYNRFFSKYGNFGTDALNSDGAGDEVVEALSYEVGGRQTWLGGYFDAALYHTTQDNVPRRNGGAIESVSVEQSGLELEVQSRLTDSLVMSAGYMHIIDVQATRENGEEVNTNIFWGGQTASVPENQMSLRVEYQAAPDWKLWGFGFHSTGYESIDADGNVTERPAFTRVDFGAAWEVQSRLVLRGRVENVLDEKDFGQTVEGSVVNDSGKLGRVFWVGVDYTF